MATKVKTLMFGITGDNSAGGEARMISCIEDFTSVFKERIEFGVLTSSIDHAKRYLDPGKVKLIKLGNEQLIHKLPFIIKEYDLLVLAEGAVFTEHFSPLLLYKFLYGMFLARTMGKKVICYANDVGNLSWFNAMQAKREINAASLVIVRSYDAYQRLRHIGVKRQVHVTADTAFVLKTPTAKLKNDLLRQLNLYGKKNLVGIAPKDFYWWPVTLKGIGKKEDQFKGPLYYSWKLGSREDSKRFKQLMARYIDWLITEHDKDVILFAIEEWDSKPCLDIIALSKNRERIKFVPSETYNLDEQLALIAACEMLISGDYHGCIFGLMQKIPMITLSMDIRTDAICKETDLMEYYINSRDNDILQRLYDMTMKLEASLEPMHEKMIDQAIKLKGRAMLNREILSAWAKRNYPA